MGDGQRGRKIRSGSKYVLSIFAYWIFRGDGMVHKEQSKVHTSEPFAKIIFSFSLLSILISMNLSISTNNYAILIIR